MSKMSDMAQTIEELRSAAAAITDAAKLSQVDPKHYEALILWNFQRALSVDYHSQCSFYRR